MKFVESLDEESKRAVREELDEETLVLFDLLVKPDLKSKERKRIKQVAKGLLERLKAEKLKIDNWREKQSTRDAVMVEIKNYLWDEETGLPVGIYEDKDVDEKAEAVYLHVLKFYPGPDWQGDAVAA